MFKVLQKDPNSLARAGIILTSHGQIETPAYAIVGTEGEIRCLKKENIEPTKTQVIIVNTYHLSRLLNKSLDSFEGLHKKMSWDGPLMTDSGGFQVFSLGFSREHGVGKIASIFPEESSNVKKKCFSPEKNLVRITKDGVYFKNQEGDESFLSPKLSIKIQEKLGADIIFAFDECTSPFHDYEYTKKALKRTHEWAIDCIKTHTRKDQLLFGIVQGGKFKDLREESARYIDNLQFDGYGIGGSLGESRDNMLEVVEWVMPFLQENKPRHLLGIGKINDIFENIERGIDTFDCVIPTREARHGAIWTENGRFDITKTIYSKEKTPMDKSCECQVCGEWSIKKDEIHQKFKDKNKDAARFATIHNVFFFNNMMEKIRNSIKENKFKEFKKMFMSKTLK